MDFKELSTVNFFGFTNVKNSIDWSEDNKIAIITKKGVTVLDLFLSRKSCRYLVYTRSMIVPHDSKPTYETGVDANKTFVQSEKLEVYEMMMNPLLYIGLQISERLAPETLQASWSHAGMVNSYGCLLATRQNTGSLVIYQKSKSMWSEVLNITSLWIRHLKDNVWENTEITKNKLFSILKSRVNQIEVTFMAWSQVVCTEESYWCLLFVSHRNSTIVVWKIERVLNHGEITATIVTQQSVIMDRICHMSWHSNGALQGLLVMGDVKGRVCTMLLDDISASSDITFHVKTVWEEEDLIAVSNVVTELQENKWFITAIKGSCLVTVVMSADGQHLSDTVTNLGTLDITGVHHIGNSSFLVATQCGSLKKVQLTIHQDTCQLETESLPAKLNTKNYRLQGMGISKNNLIYAATLTVSTPHDHLILRIQTKVVFFTFATLNSVWETLQLQQHNNDIRHIWDYLELLRLLSQGSSWDFDIQHIDMNNKENLRLIWWLTILKQQLDTKDTEKMEMWNKLQQRLESLIRRQHVCRVLELAATQFEQSAEKQLSLRLMRKWLQQHVETCRTSGEDISDITSQFLDYNSQSNTHELCAICSTEVTSMDAEKVTCQAGHTLPRCTLSLLPCCEVPLLSCCSCNVVAMDKPSLNLDTTCLYCCRPMEIDDLF